MSLVLPLSCSPESFFRRMRSPSFLGYCVSIAYIFRRFPLSKSPCLESIQRFSRHVVLSLGVPLQRSSVRGSSSGVIFLLWGDVFSRWCHVLSLVIWAGPSFDSEFLIFSFDSTSISSVLRGFCAMIALFLDGSSLASWSFQGLRASLIPCCHSSSVLVLASLSEFRCRSLELWEVLDWSP